MKKQVLVLTLSVAISCSTARMALADFQYIPGPGAETSGSGMQAPSPAASNNYMATPLGDTMGQAMPSNPMPMRGRSEPAQGPSPVLVVPDGNAAPSAMIPASPVGSGGEVLAGFGHQVPLVMAIREIVPASYQFAYDANVPLGAMVDWKGGRPWRDVLTNMLKPLGMRAAESNNVIYIGREGATR